MPILAIIVIVVVVIILSKTGISDSLIGLVIATVAGLLTGSGTAGVASVVLTPFLGIPIGLFIGVTVFAKVLRWFSRH